MAPERRDEIVALDMKSILAGTLATLTSAAVLAILLRQGAGELAAT